MMYRTLWPALAIWQAQGDKLCPEHVTVPVHRQAQPRACQVRRRVELAVLAPVDGPVFNHVLRLIQPVAVERPRLVARAHRFAAGVIEEVLERVVPEAQQVSDERLRLPAEVGDELLKLGGEADLVVVVEFGDFESRVRGG
jgi:hypothetical protein